MTAQEMKNEFLILYDKISNFDAPGYEDDEISTFLTKGQEQVLFSHYNAVANTYGKGFEETEARRKDLKELVVGADISVPSNNQDNVLPNGVLYTLPSDCLYVISEEATILSSEKCKEGLRVKIKPITHDEYSINIKNPFKKPSKNVIWRLDYSGKQHELISDDSFSIDTYHLRYVKRLTPIIIGQETIDGVNGPLDCLLDDIIHRRIVDTAVRIATGITDPQSYQIKTIEQKEGE